MRIINLAISATFLTLAIGACSQPDGTAQREAELRACHLQDDPSITADVTVHACDPEQTKKTTICHIPPGNPANAHTLCVGNAAVRAHVANHGDTVGPCASEPPCDPGDGDVDAGAGSGSGPGSDPAPDGGVVIL